MLGNARNAPELAVNPNERKQRSPFCGRSVRIAIRKKRLHLPNADNRNNCASEQPNIEAVVLPEAIKNHQRAQNSFYKNYKTAHPAPRQSDQSLTAAATVFKDG